jgi:hypothetical protein
LAAAPAIPGRRVLARQPHRSPAQAITDGLIFMAIVTVLGRSIGLGVRARRRALWR